MSSRTTRRRLPSLKALRAFEAVSHCQSFTAAAEELAVSQGAVSHQIKLLEQALGCQLLIRGPRGVTVTAEGALLTEVCSRAFDEIGAVTTLIGQDNRAQILRVRAGPFFSMEVIASRIAGFLKQNPGIQLHLNNLDIDSIAQDREDAQIKYCLHAPPGAYSIDLLTEKLVPVCSPALLEGVANPEGLLTNPDIPRLHYRDMSDWKRWIGQHGLGDIAANSNLYLTTSTHYWQQRVPDRVSAFLIGRFSRATCNAVALASCPRSTSSQRNPTSSSAATRALPLTQHCGSFATGSSPRFRRLVRRMGSPRPIAVCFVDIQAYKRGKPRIFLRGFLLYSDGFGCGGRI
ncbi:LysR family transcriptional regulator [Brucella haematophila]|uniref:LysR family transcriptional regulator n=1 Tax=Brucella haematophila TaxID=419474 RepID=UPI001F33CA23|nr:LysR family transcriptional regulator [Brucella haematophila]